MKMSCVTKSSCVTSMSKRLLDDQKLCGNLAREGCWRGSSWTSLEHPVQICASQETAARGREGFATKTTYYFSACSSCRITFQYLLIKLSVFSIFVDIEISQLSAAFWSCLFVEPFRRLKTAPVLIPLYLMPQEASV